MTTTIEDLAQALKAAAEEATPGPWEFEVDGIQQSAGNWEVVLETNCYPYGWSGCSGARLEIKEQDRAHIARANPENILRLVEDWRRLRALENR